MVRPSVFLTLWLLPVIQLAPVFGGFLNGWGRGFLLGNQPFTRGTTQRMLWKAEKNIFTQPRSQVHAIAVKLDGVVALEGQGDSP